MNESNKKTTQDRSEDVRVVFRFFSGLLDRLAVRIAAAARPLVGGDERLWRALAFWSVIVFAATAGIGATVWTYVDGRAATQLAGFLGKYRDGAEPPVENPEPAARRVLDGRPLDSAPEIEPAPWAVVIDNFVEARPQAGLNQAALVIESLVEAGITRFLAIFPGDAETAKIGPVRSARPYFIDWAEEYAAAFVHVGGSPEALAKIAASPDLRDFNEYSRGGFFWRDKTRKAPHNVYTSGRQLAEAAAKVWPEPARALLPWKFKSDETLSSRPAQVADLEVPSSNEAYARAWRYDREANDYVRIQDGGEYRDQDGDVVRAKNVVVQFAEVVILDQVGRRRIGTVGQGQALVASGGRVVKGTWQKSPAGGRTRFYDESGAEAVFHAGTTWIQVVPKGTELVYE